MAQHPKGDRHAVMVRLPVELRDALVRACADEGITGAGPYIVDLVAAHLGRPDLIRERGREEPHLLTA